MTDREKRLQNIIDSLREILGVPFRADVREHARMMMIKRGALIKGLCRSWEFTNKLDLCESCIENNIGKRTKA